MRGFIVSVVVLVVCGIVGVASSQPMLTLESPSQEGGGHFGYCISGGSDVDGDCTPDLVVAAPHEEVTPNGEGRIFTFHGFDGTLLLTIDSPPGGGYWYYHIGSRMAGVGDLDSDGHDDIVSYAFKYDAQPGDPNWYAYTNAYSGETGGLLWDRGGGPRALCAAGDINSDGHSDVLATGDGAVVFSGVNGYTLLGIDNPGPNDHAFGRSLSQTSDKDDDGLNDFLVGAPGWYDSPDHSFAGKAYVFSSSDGLALDSLASANPESAGAFGCSVAGEGDTNGDGSSELLIGACREDGGAIDAGRVYLFSGSDGALLETFLSPSPEVGGQFGYCLASIGDVNGDGFDDILIGAPYEDGGAVDAGRAYVFSGTGALLATLESPNPEPNGLFGYSLDGLGDTNGDGSPDFAIGAPYEDGGAVDAGRVYVYSGGTVPVELAGFAAVARNDQVLLTWSTLSETETFGFHVYRSISQAQDYTRITASVIPGAGTSPVRHDYSYTDATVEPGTHFYKLADVDFGGTQTMHGPVSVTVLPTSFSLLGAHPNPFSETTTLRINLPCNGHLNVTIHNMAGELVRTLADGEMDAGVQEIVWSGRGDAGKSVAPGTYTCRAEFEDRMQTAKVVVTR